MKMNWICSKKAFDNDGKILMNLKFTILGTGMNLANFHIDGNIELVIILLNKIVIGVLFFSLLWKVVLKLRSKLQRMLAWYVRRISRVLLISSAFFVWPLSYDLFILPNIAEFIPIYPRFVLFGWVAVDLALFPLLLHYAWGAEH